MINQNPQIKVHYWNVWRRDYLIIAYFKSGRSCGSANPHHDPITAVSFIKSPQSHFWKWYCLPILLTVKREACKKSDYVILCLVTQQKNLISLDYVQLNCPSYKHCAITSSIMLQLNNDCFFPYLIFYWLQQLTWHIL